VPIAKALGQKTWHGDAGAMAGAIRFGIYKTWSTAACSSSPDGKPSRHLFAATSASYNAQLMVRPSGLVFDWRRLGRAVVVLQDDCRSGRVRSWGHGHTPDPRGRT